jgi:Fe-S cluster assembly protein SufB
MENQSEDILLAKTSETEYKYGFTTDVEQEYAEIGLSEDIVRFISAKKNEPEWMLEWRLKAYQQWLKMEEPDWAKLGFPKIDFQSIIYYAASKKKPKLNSLDEVDPEIRKTWDKLGISAMEQNKLGNVAMDFVMDSESVFTSFKEELNKKGIIFCSISEAIKEHGDLVKQYIGSVVPPRDNFYSALNSAVFSDGSFVYIPKGVRCPMELVDLFQNQC